MFNCIVIYLYYQQPEQRTAYTVYATVLGNQVEVVESVVLSIALVAVSQKSSDEPT